MADFSLTTMFVVPVGQSALPSTGSTQDLTAGQLGIFTNLYVSTSTPGTDPYFYIAQGRTNTYLEGSKRSGKIKGCTSTKIKCKSNVTEWYKSSGCSTPRVQITDISGFNVQCGELVTLTLRAFSSYLNTLYFNGFTRSVTVKAPCCDCGGDPCTDVDVPTLIDSIITKLEAQGTNGPNPDNIKLTDFFTFERVGADANAILRIHGKALTAYAQACDIAAFPHEYDRMTFRTWVIEGPATTADFIVDDSCDVIATSTITQTANYATGTSVEVAQLEKNYFSYQSVGPKHLHRTPGYNPFFESFVNDGSVYDLFYIKFNQLDLSAGNWGDYIPEDQMVIIAAVADSTISGLLETALEDALGTVTDNNTCITTTTSTSSTSTTTTTAAPTTTTTTTE